jgi:hypothetical protein
LHERSPKFLLPALVSDNKNPQCNTGVVSVGENDNPLIACPLIFAKANAQPLLGFSSNLLHSLLNPGDTKSNFYSYT